MDSTPQRGDDAAVVDAAAAGDPEPATDGIGPRWRYGRRGYALARGLDTLRERPFASAATLLALGVVLALPALALFVADALDALGARALEGESITLYLDPSVPDEDGAALAATLGGRAGVRETRYVSRDEALAALGERLDIVDTLAALDENPLPGAVVVYPTAATLAAGGVEPLAEALAALDGVERLRLDLAWVQRLRAAIDLVRAVAALLGAFLLLTALLVIANTVRLELARRRAELEVARLLGAGRVFLWRPVLYGGILYGFLGGLVACVLALIAFALLQGPADELARLYASELRLGLPSASDLGLVLLVSTALGLLGALLALYGASRQSFLDPQRWADP